MATKKKETKPAKAPKPKTEAVIKMPGGKAEKPLSLAKVAARSRKQAAVPKAIKEKRGPGVSELAVKFVLEHPDLKGEELQAAAKSIGAAPATIASWRTAARLVCKVLVDLGKLKAG
jgi:hypothetical protein